MSDAGRSASLPVAVTARLVLRAWRPGDPEDVARMRRLCGDPEVMRHFPRPLEPAESAALVERLARHHAAHGFTYFAAERRDSEAFVGFVGLLTQDLSPELPPCVDVGWRLVPEAWGQGLATEGARAALDLAFGRLGLAAVHAFAPLVNHPSIRVMERLGMSRRPDLDHPLLLHEPRLRRCAHFVQEAPR